MPSYVHNDRAPDFLSVELRDYLHSRGIATSKTSRYNPRGNGQAERYNGTVWKAVTLALKSKDLPSSSWELVLPDALHSVRSLLCTATNCTPHERMFNFQRKSVAGSSVPSWLAQPGPVYVRKHVRGSKYDPIVEEAELIEANPEYAFIRLKTGHETTVSLRDLAPCGDNEGSIADSSDNVRVEAPNPSTSINPVVGDESPVEAVPTTTDHHVDNRPVSAAPVSDVDQSCVVEPRRSSRSRREPDRFADSNYSGMITR